MAGFAPPGSATGLVLEMCLMLFTLRRVLSIYDVHKKIRILTPLPCLHASTWAWPLPLCVDVINGWPLLVQMRQPRVDLGEKQKHAVISQGQARDKRFSRNLVYGTILRTSEGFIRKMTFFGPTVCTWCYHLSVRTSVFQLSTRLLCWSGRAKCTMVWGAFMCNKGLIRLSTVILKAQFIPKLTAGHLLWANPWLHCTFMIPASIITDIFLWTTPARLQNKETGMCNSQARQVNQRSCIRSMTNKKCNIPEYLYSTPLRYLLRGALWAGLYNVQQIYKLYTVSRVTSGGPG